MPGFVWLIAAYVSFMLLTAVTLYRIASLIFMPFHLRWELAPIPGSTAHSDSGDSGTRAGARLPRSKRHSFAESLVYMLKEIFLLRSVRENNRALWVFTYCMHLGLYISVMLWFITWASLLLPGILETALTWHILHAAGFAGYAACTAGALGIIILRLFDDGLRRYSSTATFFNLALVMFFSISGLVMWCFETSPVDTVSMFAENCMTANPNMALYGPSAVHVASLLLFAAALPFTQMIHFAAKFFTFHRVLWDDRPPGHFHQDKLTDLMNASLQWSAPHAGGGSLRSWKKVIDGEGIDEKK